LKLKPGEEEFTVMRIIIEGKEKGQAKKHQYYLLDRTEKETGILSMARTTGYTCTGAVHLVIDGRFNRKGINPPEYLGEQEDHFQFMLQHLKNRGVNYNIETQ
jgi:saccharopine dehydrogenase-like NADP-dependent oxidoreductase